MNHFLQLGKLLVMAGAVIIALGLLFLLLSKLKWTGHLPGDIYIQKKNFSFYFPLTTCIVLSVILSFLFWLFFKK